MVEQFLSKRKKLAQTITNFFEITLINSKRKPDLIGTDRGNEFYNIMFHKFLNKNNLKHCFKNTFLGAAFAEKFNRFVRDLFQRPVFEKAESNWVDMLPGTTKQYNNRVHTSPKLTPTQAS